MTKNNTLNLKDIYTLTELMRFEEFSYMKPLSLTSYLVSKGASKLVLDAPFTNTICFYKSQVDNVIDEMQ